MGLRRPFAISPAICTDSYDASRVPAGPWFAVATTTTPARSKAPVFCAIRLSLFFFFSISITSPIGLFLQTASSASTTLPSTHLISWLFDFPHCLPHTARRQLLSPRRSTRRHPHSTPSLTSSPDPESHLLTHSPWFSLRIKNTSAKRRSASSRTVSGLLTGSDGGPTLPRGSGQQVSFALCNQPPTMLTQF